MQKFRLKVEIQSRGSLNIRRSYYEISILIRQFGQAMGHKKCIDMELDQRDTDGGQLLDRTGFTRQAPTVGNNVKITLMLQHFIKTLIYINIFYCQVTVDSSLLQFL